MIGVAGRDELPRIESFIATRGVDGFPHIADVSGEVWSEFDVRGQPFFIFIDDDGTEFDRAGSLGLDGLTEMLSALVEA